MTVIAIWLIPSDQPEPVDIPLPTAVTEKSTMPPVPQPGPAPVEEQAREGDKARQIISRHKQEGGALEDLFDQAGELSAQGELADAYLLLFYAARNGHPESALILGKQSDPALFTAGTSIQERPDIVQAHKWYNIAAEKGNTEAEILLDGLKLTVSDQATSGDPVAEGLLLQWK